MGRQVGADAHLAQARAVQKQLAATGIDDHAIEQLFAQPGKLDAILSDNRLLLQYFQIQSRGLHALTSWDFDNPFMSGNGQTLPPNHNNYISYYSAERDPVGPVAGQDYIQENWVLDPSHWQTNLGFSPEQVHWFNTWMNDGLFGDAGTSAGSGQGTSGGSAGPKIGAMAVGRPKAYAAGGAPKYLGPKAPPTPPAGGGGGDDHPAPQQPFGSGGTLFNQTAFNYINSLEGGWGHDVLMGCFQDENYSNGVCYNIMQQIQSQKSSVQEIQNFINGIDTSTPEGRHQFTMANQQLGNLQGNIRDYMDALGTVKRRADERKEYVKSMMDTVWRAQDSIIRNIGRSG